MSSAMNRCLYCNKKTSNKKFCNHACAGHITGKINGKKAQQVLKQRKAGFYNSKLQHKLGKRGQKVIRDNKLGIYHPSRYCTIRGHITSKRNKTGFWNSETQRENGIKGGKKTGSKVIEILRNHSKYTWNHVHFLSKAERECAKRILNRPVVGVNCHVKVGTKIFDFYPQQDDKMFQGCFVEYHPILKFFYPTETSKKYYYARRKVLNENGFMNKQLIVIKNLKELGGK